MSCNRHYGISLYAPCSGNGECIDNICYCNPEFTSCGDFEPTVGYDCDINITTIRVISGINIAIAFFSTIIVIKHILNQQPPKNAKDKSYDPKYLFPYVMLWNDVGIFLFYTLKLIDPTKFYISNQTIGGILLTAAICLMYNCTVIGFSLFIDISYSFLMGYSMMMSYYSRDLLIKKLNFINISNVPVAVFLCVMSMTIAIAGQIIPSKSDTILIA